MRVYHSNHSFTKNPGGIGVTDRPWGPEKSERLWGRAIRNFIKSHTYTDIICIYMISYIYIYMFILVIYLLHIHVWNTPECPPLNEETPTIGWFSRQPPCHWECFVGTGLRASPARPRFQAILWDRERSSSPEISGCAGWRDFYG